MLGFVTPDYYLSSYRKLDGEMLIKKGIKVLICDIDNTLVAHDEALPDASAKEFIHRMLQCGLDVILISNNVEERVATFAQGLDDEVKYYPFAKKPLKHTYKKMLKEQGYKASEAAVIGDQLLTDVIGAKRMHFYTILTCPVAQKDLTCTKINRVFENMIYKILAKKKRLVKGEYDE